MKKENDPLRYKFKEERKVFTFFTKIRLSDLDINRHVYNMYYNSYYDEARSEMFKTLGLDLKTMRSKRIGPMSLKAIIEYKKEINYPDNIKVETWFGETTKTRSIIYQEIFSENCSTLASIATYHGFIMDFTKKRPWKLSDEFLLAVGVLK